MTQEFLINEAIKIAAELTERTTMTNDYEIMKIAVDLQRNYLYAKANVISQSDTYEPALESIATSLKSIKNNL